jgi:hypothetical protein
MKNQESYKPSSFATSKWGKTLAVIFFIVSWGFVLWGSISFINWFNPNPETASSGRRLAADLLFLPMFLIAGIASSFGSILLLAWVGRKLNLKGTSNEEYSRPTYTELLRTKAVHESNDWMNKRPPDVAPKTHPSEWPYWLMVLFFGSLFATGLFFVVQDMVIRHVPSEDWVVIGFLLAILGAPTFLGVLRIRQIQRGEPIDDSKPSQSINLPPALVHFLGYLAFGIVLLVFGSFIFFTAERTLQFQKIARPAEGVVTRWVYHPGYRSGHYNVEVRYQMPEGRVRVVECASPSFFDFLRPNVGEKVDLLYNPYNPLEVRLAQFSEMWSGTLFCVFVFVVVSTVVGIRIFNQKNKGAFYS